LFDAIQCRDIKQIKELLLNIGKCKFCNSCCNFVSNEKNIDEFIDPPLFVAVYNNDYNLAEEIIINTDADVNILNILGNTVIYFAVCNNNLDMVQLLIDYGANLNWNINYNVNLFTITKNKTMLKLLIKNGANIDMDAGYPGCTLLYYAIVNNDYDMIDFLLDNNINVNSQHGDWGTTPLIIACYNNDLNLVKKLTEHGANVNLQKYNKESPLSIAIENNNQDIIAYLRANGAIEKYNSDLIFDEIDKNESYVKPEIIHKITSKL
jgi:ankyrin repeat protein